MMPPKYKDNKNAIVVDTFFCNVPLIDKSGRFSDMWQWDLSLSEWACSDQNQTVL